MITFLHFSDFHLPNSRGELREGSDPCEMLERLIGIARELDARPSFSLITGDISQDATMESYCLVKEFMSEIEGLGGPVLPAVGNRDRRGNFRSVLIDEGGVDEDPCYYSRSVGGLKVIVLDSQTTGTNRGSFEGGQLAWLEDELQDESDPSIIAFHHPVFEVPRPNGTAVAVFDPADSKRFREIVSGSNVQAVLCGHLHHSNVTSISGISHIMSGSAVSELTFNDADYSLHESSSFNLVTIYKERLMVRPVTYSGSRRLIRRRPIPELTG